MTNLRFSVVDTSVVHQPYIIEDAYSFFVIKMYSRQC